MPLFYENGLSFSCQRCSHCCRIEPGFVFLSRLDLTNLCLWFKLPEDSFIEKYCRRVPYLDGKTVLCLKETETYDCIFWKDGGCSAYGARPVQCSTYPFWTRLLSCKSEWEAEKDSCPGIDHGRIWKKDEIARQLEKYEINCRERILWEEGK